MSAATDAVIPHVLKAYEAELLDEWLREQASAYLAMRYPELKEGAAQLVGECLANAQASFRNEFICRLSPQAWARITLIYFKHFVDTGCDVSIGEIFATVIRDSININRMDMLTLQLAQEKLDQAPHKKKPSLTIIKDP